MASRWFGWKAGCLFFLALLLMSAGNPDAKNAPKEQPRKVGDPAIYWWYKSEAFYVGKEINKLSININEEFPVSIQALDSNGLDTATCPKEWKSDKAVLAITPIENRCNAVKVKGLKAAENISLTVVYKGAKGNDIEAVLKGSVGAAKQARQNRAGESSKSNPPQSNQQQPGKNKPK